MYKLCIGPTKSDLSKLFVNKNTETNLAQLNPVQLPDFDFIL